MWNVFIKEALELSRDKRVLLTMLLIPLVFLPLMMGIGAGASAFVAKKQHTKTLTFAIEGELEGYQLISLFNQKKGLQRTQLALGLSPEQAVKEEQVDFVLVVEGELPQLQWKLVHNGAKVFSRAKRLIRDVQQQLAREWQAEQLAKMGLSDKELTDWLQPVEFKEISVADEREKLGSVVGGFLPYLVLVLALSGAMYPAIDIGAGEKERGTLETLLMAPLSVAQLIRGKIAIVALSAFISALLTLISLVGWSSLAALGLKIEVVQRVMESVHLGDLLLLVLLLIPVAVIFGAMMTAISFFARSFKEAQNYMGLAYTIPIIPLMLASMPGIELNWVWAMVPLSNVALAIKELLKGTLEWHYLILIWLNAAIVAGLFSQLSVRWCSQEKVLFR